MNRKGKKEGTKEISGRPQLEDLYSNQKKAKDQRAPQYARTVTAHKQKSPECQTRTETTGIRSEMKIFSVDRVYFAQKILFFSAREAARIYCC